MSRPVLGSAVLLGSYEPGGEEWREARLGRVGASDIAAVLGLSKWHSPFSLWHFKAGNTAPEVDNREMEWGRDLEALIARRFAREHPRWRLSRCGLYANRERPWQIAQPDRVIHYGQRRLGALEIKTDRHADEWGAEGTDEIPIYYLCQTRWQLDTFGWDECHLAVLIAGSEYREYLVRADSGDTELMRSEAQRFLSSLEARTPPDIDSHTATYRAVRELHPEIDGEDVEIDPALAKDYLLACADFTDAEDRKRYAGARVAYAMGTGRRAVCKGKPIAIRVPGRNGATPHLRPARRSLEGTAA